MPYTYSSQNIYDVYILTEVTRNNSQIHQNVLGLNAGPKKLEAIIVNRFNSRPGC